MSINKTALLAPGLAICAFAALAANKPSDQKPAESRMVAVPADDDDTPTHNKEADALIGFYVGPMGPHKLTIRLEKMVGDTVLGYNIVGGNQRAFSGSFVKQDEEVTRFEVREPGDHPEDGVFRMVVTSDRLSMVGTWTPNDKKQKPISFSLKRREFRYNPKVGQYPQSSTRKLTEKDVENMRDAELRIMRNEMYARHGYSFKLVDMRKHFDQQEWYMPMATDVSSKLTAIEKHNHDLIKRYEDYGREYYDTFGR